MAKHRVHRREIGLLVAYGTLAVFWTLGSRVESVLENWVLSSLVFAWLFFVVVWCALATVRHADSLADIVGEPAGTLILTFCVVVIEVSLIAAVMVTGDGEPELARDTMFAVLMIVLNGMIGVSLLFGAIFHREQSFNFHGTSLYLSVLVPVSVISLVLPRFTITTEAPTFSFAQAIVFSTLILLLYCVFLRIQTVRHRAYFLDKHPPATTGAEGDGEKPIRREPDEVVEAPRWEGSQTYHGVFHLLLMLAFLAPIVLLSKQMALFIDHAVGTLGIPTAIGGVIIAAIVLFPEGLHAVHSALGNHLQRAINTCFGAAFSTIGLMVPVVLIVGLILEKPIVLGLHPVEMILLVLTMVNCVITFRGDRTSVLQGAVHLVLFVAYLALIFDP